MTKQMMHLKYFIIYLVLKLVLFVSKFNFVSYFKTLNWKTRVFTVV